MQSTFNTENILDRIQETIADENYEQLRDILNSYHSADLAELLQELKFEERIIAFNNIEEEKAADIIEYLPAKYQVEILSEIGQEYASKLLLKMPHDEIADVLADMEEDESESYLNKLPVKFSSEIRELLSYKEDSAGGIMTPNLLTVDKDMKVEEVLSFIKVRAEKDNVELYYIYVIDNQNHLLGVISLRALLTTPSRVKIGEIMTCDIVKLHIDDPQENVAEIFKKYQYSALPVVDHYNRLKGMVTWDDAQDIIEVETTEEIYTSSGITTNVIAEDEILTGNTLNAIRARTPWLLITLIGEFFAVNVANRFEHTLHALPIIAIFMPLLAGLGGNIGTQSITLMVRGLSTGQVNLNSAFHHIFRELRIGFLIGSTFGILVTLVTWQWRHNFELGIVVGCAMTINMSLATLLGTITPFILKKMKIDPAIASGPVIATAIDVLGLAIYFTLVSIFLLKVI